MTTRRRRISRLGIAAVAALALLPQTAGPGGAATTAATCAPTTTPTGAPFPGGEWRSYGHDYANTRTQDQETTITPSVAKTLAPAWTFSSTSVHATGDFTGTPVVADGCVFVGSNGGWVFALNADTGALVWRTQVTTKGGVDSSLNVSGGRVYAGVAVVGSPSAVALDEATGAVLWQTQLDAQPGADEFASPVVFNNLVFLGVSGGAAELSDTKVRYPFEGSFVLLDATTGAVVKKTYTIHPPSTPADKYAGANIWSTPAIDPIAQVAYVGTGNPFQPQAQAPTADSILKIDMNPASATFGQILAHYNGLPDTYANLKKLPCVPIPGNPPPYYPQGLGSCMQIDLDFGSSPNLFTGASGRLLVGEGQKSGVYHVADTATMQRVWTATVGPPSAVGGIVGSTAYDGHAVYGPVTPGGYLWSVNGPSGSTRWLAPIGDGAHYGNPVAVADGVVYTVDLSGFLDAFAASTGLPLIRRPIVLGSKASEPIISWGGVSVARNTVYAAVGTTALASGYIVAFRPQKVGVPQLPSLPQAPQLHYGSAAVAGPGAQFTGYATRIVVASRLGKLTFYNSDIVQHDVTGDNGLFGSPLVGLGQSAAVTGLQSLVAGQRYTFHCSIHPGMRGTLWVTK